MISYDDNLLWKQNDYSETNVIVFGFLLFMVSSIIHRVSIIYYVLVKLYIIYIFLSYETYQLYLLIRWPIQSININSVYDKVQTNSVSIVYITVCNVYIRCTCLC